MRSTNDNADYKSKYYALIGKLVVDNVEATSQPLNDGASINAISPAFIQKNSLENKVVEHETKLALTMANTETVHVNKKTIKLDIVINGFKPYTAEFFILPVPDDRNVLLGMPWLHDVNPRINWRTGEIRPSRDKLRQCYQ
ncbi:Hypothetical protein PHPALM_11707 [Phytophthora palmivora]|uniref:Uncharacterized protein n=1 Tax=Phytophthora palmivora TaxID=4796 RepID=A0A2P4Y1L7_9STRA|nr:Hypothetical protein PHPALM_11707 [Phytophthora palmivora]